MKEIRVSYKDFKENANFSPEFWLTKSFDYSGKVLDDYCNIKTTEKNRKSPFILNTNGANNGLIQLVNYGSNHMESKSHTKQMTPGVVIISKLRTNLRQVACFSEEVSEIIDIKGFTISSEFLTLSPVGCSPYFLTLLLLSETVQKHLIEGTSGGHLPRVTIELLLSTPVKETDIKFAVENEKIFKDICVNYALSQKKLLDLYDS